MSKIPNMSLRKNIPSTASVAIPGQDGRLLAPAADRNAKPIVDLVVGIAPERGQALEIASGTGQHIVKLAAATPELTWQPSDIDPLRIASIKTWSLDKTLVNLKTPVLLDATQVGWSSEHTNQNFVLLVNLIHLISVSEARTIISEISLALAPSGRSIIYGPFKRDGKLTTPGDKSFHQSLKEADPEIGYKNDTWMIDQFSIAGLALLRIEQMPANNLAFVVEKHR
jgi:hypothetical protein